MHLKKLVRILFGTKSIEIVIILLSVASVQMFSN